MLASCRKDTYHMKTVCPRCGSIKDERSIFCKICSYSLGIRRRGTGNYPDMKSNGYILTCSPEHPKADKDGYVKRSILVWEQETGNLFPSGYHIHHKDNNRENDVPFNLEVVAASEHCRITTPWRYRK